jgi:prepilin-type N-terminal cleavage/methylation domain-containing protein
MPIKSKNSAFTLLEIMVSLVILASAAGGLFASFVASQKFVSRSRHRLAAMNGCRLIMEDLRAYVDQATWDDSGVNPLACPGGVYPCTRNFTLPAADYPPGAPWNWAASYEIDQELVNGVNIRKVSITVSWDEPAG